jgi:regulation of enolase protein 1 (concanavalin A-like superfamily)
MTWLNPPATEFFDTGTVTVRCKGKTDFWRKTFYGYINDNGHFLHLPVSGEFQFQARVIGNYSQLYDQAGIMVRLDEKHWMKCGSEFFDNKRWASVVFTHDFSDWSTMEDLSQNGAVYWRVVRKKDSLEAQVSKDGEVFTTIRQGYFPANVQVDVGVMCAAPEGSGFDSTFDQLEISQLK